MKASLAPLNLHLSRTIALLTLLLLPCVLLAQNPRGSLRGTVQDSSAGRISSAKIVVQAPESALQRETIANDQGDFRIDGLGTGKYRLTMTAKRFANDNSDVN